MKHVPKILLLVCVGLISLTTAQAQSGRRSTGGSTTTTTAPSVSGPKPVEKRPTAEPRVQLLVGMSKADAFTTTPFYIYDTVLDICIRRLGEAEIVFAASAGNNMTRGEAVKAAKEETTRWVVSLEIRSIFADAGRKVTPEQDEMYVTYAVIEPVTGKVKRAGQTRQRIYQTRRGEITYPPQNRQGYSEYSIKQTAMEAADRILEGFDIRVRQSRY